MKIYYELDLASFEAWSGGEDTLKALTYDQINLLECMLSDIFGEDECTETELNDLLRFEQDSIAEWLGFSDWEELEHINAGDEKLWKIRMVSNSGNSSVEHSLGYYDNEDEANDFCEEHDWEYTDENGCVWNLEIEEEWTNE